MVSQINPTITVTYHDPLESEIFIDEKFEPLIPISSENVVSKLHDCDPDKCELHKAQTMSPQKVTKQSQSRFHWRIPNALRPRSKSVGMSDESVIKSTMDFNIQKSIYSKNTHSTSKDSTVIKKAIMSHKESINKAPKSSEITSKFNINTNTNTKSEDKKLTTQLSESIQSKKGNLFKNIQIMSKQRPKSESISGSTVSVQKPHNKNIISQTQNICSECPPPKSSKYNESCNPQLFPIIQKKELTGNQCNHNEISSNNCEATKTKRQGKTYTMTTEKIIKDKLIDNGSGYRIRSNSGPHYDRKHFKLPDPTLLPESEPTSSLTFCRTPLKSTPDDRYYLNGTSGEGGNFQKLSKTSISKSEQNLVFSESSKRIVEALSKSRPTYLGNETIEAAIRFGVNRVTENNQFVILSKSSTRDTSTFLSEGLHTLGEAESFYAFFQHSTCYDMMPDNSKLVVLDSRLQVGKAFRALVFNGVRAALIWQSELQRYVGILTITDFIKILNLYIENTPGVSIIDIESQTIDKWREMTGTVNKPLVFVSPESSLFTALKELQNLKVHRIPVIDLRSGNALHIITHKRLLKYLYIKKSKIPNAELLKCTIEDANVGTFKDVHTVTLDTSIKEALNIFETKKISAVPVLCPNTRRLLDIYAKFDCIHLASTGNYKDLNLTISQGLAFRVKNSFSVQTCLKTDTLDFVMEKIVLSEVHRLVVINNEAERQVRGIVSLADLLHYFVLRYNGRHSTGNIISGISCCSNLNFSLNTNEHGSHRHNSSPSSLNVDCEDCNCNAKL